MSQLGFCIFFVFFVEIYIEWEKAMNEPLTTKVTRIGNFYHCRLFREGKLHDEVACNLKEDIGYCMYWMLRWYDKMCFEPFSNMATAARYRSRKSVPKGKVKYHISLKSSD